MIRALVATLTCRLGRSFLRFFSLHTQHTHTHTQHPSATTMVSTRSGAKTSVAAPTTATTPATASGRSSRSAVITGKRRAAATAKKPVEETDDEYGGLFFKYPPSMPQFSHSLRLSTLITFSLSDLLFPVL